MQRNTVIGTAAAVSVVCFWSGWMVVTRLGVTNTLTVYDITGLRFTIGAILVLPWVIKYRTWRGLTPVRVLVIGGGAGLPYALLTYFAFTYAPAAHGGVFLNGCLPVFTTAVAWIWLGQRINIAQLTGLAIILVGVVLVGYDGFSSTGNNRVWLGDSLFLIAIALFAVFMVATKVWLITPGQILFSATIAGAVVYVPCWAFFLDSNLAVAPQSELLLQGLYQGLVPSVLGISLLGVAINKLGATMASVFVSAVPVVAALAAIPILGEIPGVPTWVGMVAVTLGILLALGIFSPKTEAA